VRFSRDRRRTARASAPARHGTCSRRARSASGAATRISSHKSRTRAVLEAAGARSDAVSSTTKRSYHGRRLAVGESFALRTAVRAHRVTKHPRGEYSRNRHVADVRSAALSGASATRLVPVCWPGHAALRIRRRREEPRRMVKSKMRLRHMLPSRRISADRLRGAPISSQCEPSCSGTGSNALLTASGSRPFQENFPPRCLGRRRCVRSRLACSRSAANAHDALHRAELAKDHWFDITAAAATSGYAPRITWRRTAELVASLKL